MSIRLRLVGEGVSLLSGCCHDNHESLMPPPLDIFQPTPLSVLSTMTRKYDYRYPQGKDDVTAKKTFTPFDTSAHLM